MEAEEFNRRFFANNAMADNVLKTDQRLSREDVRRLELELKNRFGGSKNAHKTMILSGGLEVQELTTKQRDMGSLPSKRGRGIRLWLYSVILR